MPDSNLQYWLNLQSAMRELQKTQGWDSFTQQVRARHNEALADLRRDPAPRHDYHVGFLDGLDWVLSYPELLVDLVQRHREAQ